MRPSIWSAPHSSSWQRSAPAACFIAVEGSVDWRPVHRDGRPGAEVTWDGFDDDDPASGRGWAVLEEDGSVRGHLYLHLGDDSGFKAVRAGDELGRRR